MNCCNWCGYRADYIKEDSKNLEDMLCGACLTEYEKADDFYHIQKEYESKLVDDELEEWVKGLSK
jgi:hypothetical protein